MSTSKRITIRIIWPSSLESSVSIVDQIDKTKKLFDIEIRHDPLSDELFSNRQTRSSLARVKSDVLVRALTEPDTVAVLSARGGYGSGDLLPEVPWGDLASVKPKLLIGFSDISALQSALYAILKWPSIHGPMPATSYWNSDDHHDDLTQLFTLLGSPLKKGSIALKSLNKMRNIDTPRGWLFGGCFSVLTNLIGTPYFPSSLKRSIVFIEDIGESEEKLCRYLNQWLYSGCLTGVSAIILGTFNGLHTEPAEETKIQAEIWNSLSNRLSDAGIPVFSTDQIGHQNPNYPLMIGANAAITNSHLSWEQTLEEGVS